MGHQIQQKGFTLPLCAHILYTCTQVIRLAVVKRGLARPSRRNSTEWPGCTYRMYSVSFHAPAHAKAHLGLGQVVSVPASMAW